MLGAPSAPGWKLWFAPQTGSAAGDYKRASAALGCRVRTRVGS